MKENISVKCFDFPLFDEWVKQKCEWIGHINEFTCKVAVVGWGCNGNRYNDYQLAISVCDNPTNIYSPKIYNNFNKCKFDDKENLKIWYESAIENANFEWEKYIMSYFE